MKALRSRLSRIERSLALPSTEEDANPSSHRLMIRLSSLRCDGLPGIELIEREDCPDEMAWLSIESLRAWARGDWRRGRALDERRCAIEEARGDLPRFDDVTSLRRLNDRLRNDRAIPDAIERARERLMGRAVALRW